MRRGDLKGRGNKEKKNEKWGNEERENEKWGMRRGKMRSGVMRKIELEERRSKERGDGVWKIYMRC
jgi:hypothetical protein